MASDPQPESVQQIRKAPTLSDGDITYGDGLLRGSAPAEAKDLKTFEGLLNVRDVGSLYRFKRRLFGGTSAQSHAVLGKQTRLPRKRRKVSVNTHTVPSLPGIVKVSRLVSSLLARSPQPAKTWQKLSGHLSSLRELVPMAVTHTRHIQLMLHSQWTQVSDSPYLRIYPDHESLWELEWWASRANLTVGCPFLRPDLTMTIVTDASMEGWGGHPGDWVISGQWSSAWATSTGSSSRQYG